MFGKGFLTFSIITGVITTLATVVATVDTIFKGDKRAAITGDSAGRAVVDECERRNIKLGSN